MPLFKMSMVVDDETVKIYERDVNATCTLYYPLLTNFSKDLDGKTLRKVWRVLDEIYFSISSKIPVIAEIHEAVLYNLEMTSGDVIVSVKLV